MPVIGNETSNHRICSERGGEGMPEGAWGCYCQMSVRGNEHSHHMKSARKERAGDNARGCRWVRKCSLERMQTVTIKDMFGKREG